MTKLGYVVDALQELTKMSLNQISISYASHRDSFPLARTIYDAQASIPMECEVRGGREDLHDEPRNRRRSEEHITAKIQELLNQNPFESARSIAETLHISHSTALKHVQDDLHFQSFYLHWMRHLLTPELREQRCRFAREMILVLTAAVRDGWYRLVTGDESWLFLSYSPRRM
jgi:hypothetical protein